MHKSLSERPVHSIHDTERNSDTIQHPHLDDIGKDKRAHRERENARRTLCHVQESSLVERVNERPRKRSADKERRKAEREHGPERRPRPSQLKHEPAESHGLHPVAYMRKPLPYEVEAIIPYCKRRECL